MFPKRACGRDSATAYIRIISAAMMFVPAAHTLLVEPKNIAVLAGSTMVMTCKPSPEDEFIGWGVYTTTYKYFIFEHGCTAANAGDANDLKAYEEISGHNIGTIDTLLTYGGLYECLISEARGSKHRTLTRVSANLIVLENPVVKITKGKGNEIKLQCVVTYSGFWPPSVEWRFSGRTEESKSEPALNRVTAALIIWPTTDRLDYNQYSCVTYFDGSNRPENVSVSNVPSFTYTWKPYEPRNMKIDPLKDVYGHSEELLCSAEAQPEATFSWRNTDNEFIIHGPKLVVPSENGRYKFQCRAENGIGEAVTIDISFTANSSQTFSIVVYVAAVLGAAILIPLIAICIGKHRCAREAQNIQSPAIRAHTSPSARKGRNSGKTNASVELNTQACTADAEYYDDAIGGPLNTAQGYVSLVSLDNKLTSDYTDIQ